MTTRGTLRHTPGRLALCALLALLSLSGCHLIFPFSTTASDDATPAEAGPSDTGRDHPADLGPALDATQDRDAAPTVDGGPVTPDAGPLSLAFLTTSKGALKHACTPGDVAVDGSGNSYITGTFSGTVDLGQGPQTSLGAGDVFVAAYNPKGASLWSTTFGGTYQDAGIRLVVDASGLYVTGYVSGPITFAGKITTSYGSEDAFVAKLSLSGVQQWLVSAGDYATDSGMGIAVGGGAIHVTGFYTGKLHFGTQKIPAVGGRDGFIGTITASGVPGLVKTFGGTAGNDTGLAVALNSKQQPVVSGLFIQQIVIGKSTLTSLGAEDFFVVNFGALAVTPLVHLGGTSKDVTSDTAMGSADELHLVGQTEGLIDLGQGDLGQAGVKNGFLVKRSATGQPVWGRITDASGGGEAGYFSVARGAGDRVFVSGYHDGAVKLGSTVHVDKGSGAALIASYSSAGALRWSRSYGGPGGDRATAVATVSGDLWVVGSFAQTVDFEGTKRTSAAGDQDLFLLRMASP